MEVMLMSSFWEKRGALDALAIGTLGEYLPGYS